MKEPSPPKEHQTPPERRITNSFVERTASLPCRKRGHSEPPPPAERGQHRQLHRRGRAQHRQPAGANPGGQRAHEPEAVHRPHAAREGDRGGGGAGVGKRGGDAWVHAHLYGTGRGVLCSVGVHSF
jgi:hypothetical protein